MARPTLDIFANFDGPDAKRMVFTFVGPLKGEYHVTIDPKRTTRSTQQLRWYFGCIVAPFAQYLSDQDYEVTTKDAAHEILKAKFLTVDVADPRTGEVIGKRVRGTKELSRPEMAEYCERVRAWLLDFFGIVTQDPEPDPAERQKQRHQQREAAHA